MTFIFRKIISTKQNYKTHNQKLLIIVQIFKIWKHYLKNNLKTIEIWLNHNNFRKFIKQKKLNFKQIRWTLTLIIYNFEIFYRFNKINSINESSKRFNYKKNSLLNIRLLLTLQNKLTLLLIEIKISITQNKRKMSNLIFESLIYISNIVKIVYNETSLQNIKNQIQINFVLIFQLTNVTIIILKKNVKIISKKSYKKLQKSIKFLIKKFQTNDIWTKKFCNKKNALFRRRRQSKIWIIDFEKFVCYNKRLYVFKNAIVRKKLINKNYNNFLIDYFDFDKIVELLQKKYYWINCVKQTNKYIKFVTYVNALKHFDINHMINFRFYRFRKIFEKKLFEILLLNFRRINEKKSFIISFLW